MGPGCVPMLPVTIRNVLGRRPPCPVPQGRRAAGLRCSDPRRNGARGGRSRRRRAPTWRAGRAWRRGGGGLVAARPGARGTVMVRPSTRCKLSVASSKRTSRTRSSAPGAKMPMPCLQEGRLPLPDVAVQRGQLLGGGADVTREGDRMQPELGGAGAGVDVRQRGQRGGRWPFAPERFSGRSGAPTPALPRLTPREGARASRSSAASGSCPDMSRIATSVVDQGDPGEAGRGPVATSRFPLARPCQGRWGKTGACSA